MPDQQQERSLDGISENAATHMAYLVMGNDPAIPEVCDLCAELREAGLLEESAKRPHVRTTWRVKGGPSVPITGA